MRLPITGLAVGLVLQATAAEAWKGIDAVRVAAYSDPSKLDRIYVPRYNMTMPVDHFNPSDTRTFNNRYFVNDTYYKPGGPVIFYDFGETGVDDWYAAVLLAGWNGTLSAPLELAKARNGVVIGWEHRYYGYSRPFPVTGGDDQSDYDNYDPRSAGIPLGGAADYKYLTVEQALEDVAYFARRFNQTTLGGRNTVLAGANATQHLDPYNTPWIWIGGSYPGMRGTWMRLHNPDIIYAVWASSAPVQTVADGSAYSNAIYRALPQNCSADIHAAMRHIDKILDSGNETAMWHLGAQIEAAQSGYYGNPGIVDTSNFDVNDMKATLAHLFEYVSLNGAQSQGYSESQKLCKVLESFDVPGYLADLTASARKGNEDGAFLSNFDDAKPSDKGIAASNGVRGDELALAAYLYGVSWYFSGGGSIYKSKKRDVPSSSSRATNRGRGLGLSSPPSLSDKKPASDSDSDDDDWYSAITVSQTNHAWEWQVLTEVGLIVSVNGSSDKALGSKYVDHAYMRQRIIDRYFANFSVDAFPAEPDNAYPMGFGGWRMQVSNTMFTNGEFDPWVAYGVASPETELADYPNWGGIDQDHVPGCGNNGVGINSHFGIVYPGAVHTEDIALMAGDDYQRGSENTTDPPLKQGLALFQRALDVWLPCFNESRGRTVAVDPRNPNATANSTDPGDKNGADRSLSAATGGVWAVVGVFSFVFYHIL